MNVNRILNIQGEAVDTLRQFLAAWWKNVELDAMFAPVELPSQTRISLQTLTDPGELALVNPFTPFMQVNSATSVENFINEYPGKRLVAILRPCELRTLVELQKRHRFIAHSHEDGGNGAGYSGAEHSDGKRWISSSITIIGVDCPGTYSLVEYSRRIEAQGVGGLTREVLHYNAASGTMPLHIRAACDLCDRPAPLGADIVIGTLGVVPLGYLLVIASDEETDLRLKLAASTCAVAAEEQVIQREFAIDAMVNQRAARRRELSGNGIGYTEIAGGHNAFLQDLWGEKHLGSLLGLFANCTLCADCLDACPLYDGELEGMLGIDRSHYGGRPLLPELVGVSRWLVSCSGCGMYRRPAGARS